VSIPDKLHTKVEADPPSPRGAGAGIERECGARIEVARDLPQSQDLVRSYAYRMFPLQAFD
jgi:hypothetical protein